MSIDQLMLDIREEFLVNLVNRKEEYEHVEFTALVKDQLEALNEHIQTCEDQSVRARLFELKRDMEHVVTS